MKNGVIEAHAYTVKKVDEGWVLLDCYYEGPIYQKPKKDQKRWNIKSFFNTVVGSDVYVLESEKMSQEKFIKKVDKLRRLMTKDYDDITDKRREGINKTNKKRKSHLMVKKKSSRASRLTEQSKTETKE